MIEIKTSFCANCCKDKLPSNMTKYNGYAICLNCMELKNKSKANSKARRAAVQAIKAKIHAKGRV